MKGRTKPIIFFNIGWMQWYRGVTKTDKIKGGGSYVDEHDFGAEACNFRPYRGWCYGYVQAPARSDHVRIERIGADEKAEKLDEVTVVWTARRRGWGTVVVGWYRHATIYRRCQSIDRSAQHIRGFKRSLYYVRAREKDCHLVDAENRWFEIPRSRPGKRGGMGQSNVWFAEIAREKPWFKRLEDSIRKEVDPGTTKSPPGKPTRKGGGEAGTNRQSDPELRKLVEDTAVASTQRYFEEKGFVVEDIGLERCGWDLTCKKDRRVIRVEVKGTSDRKIVAELTPNEFALFSKCKTNYCLAVVTSALTRPKLNCFWWDPDDEIWMSDSAVKLQIEEVTSARVHGLEA